VPSTLNDDVFAQALSRFMANIEMPRTNLGMLEWFEKVCSFHLHEGQLKVIKAIEDGKREIDVIAGKRGGKCLARGSRVLLADGSLVPIERVEPGDTVLSLGDDLKIHPAVVQKAFCTGRQGVVKLTLESGRSIVLTEAHPLYTEDGWCPLSELGIGDLVATPRCYPKLGSYTIPPEHAAIVGYLTGDGSVRDSTPKFTNADPALVQHLQSCLPDGITLTPTGKYEYLVSGPRTGGQVSNPVTKLLQEYGAWGSLSKDKRVPGHFFNLTNEVLAAFIRALFDCDGTVGARGIEIVLASEGLIDDLQHLLLRYGIRAYKHYKKSTCSGYGTFDAWRLTFSAKDSLLAYQTYIGFVGEKSRKLEERLAEGLARAMNRDDIIPGFPLHECYQALARKVLDAPAGRWNPYTDREGYELLRRARVEHIARDSAQAIADHFGIGRELAYSDIAWDRIKDIEPMGEAPHQRY